MGGCTSIHVPDTSKNIAEVEVKYTPASPTFKGFSKHIVKETHKANIIDGNAFSKQVNQYVFKKLLGQGSFAAVYLAESMEDQKQYAVKIFSKTSLKKKRVVGRGVNQSDQFEAVKREIAIMKRCSNHPNIVKLFEVIDDPTHDSLFLVLEFLEGGLLLKDEASFLPEAACLKYFKNIIDGIDYCVAHRDIKPENILISSDDVAKLADFGVSKLLDKESDDIVKDTAGSAAFMAPEMCAANSNPFSAKRTDIWSAGITLYCMTFGKVPFNAISVPLMYTQILESPLIFPESSNVSDALKDLIGKILRKNPSERIDLSEIKSHNWLNNIH